MVSATVVKIQDGQVTLSLPNGQTFQVPESAVEGKPVLWSTVNLLIVMPGGEDAARSSLAKNILNELIGESSEK